MGVNFMKLAKNTAISILSVCVLAYVCACIGLFFLQRSMLYHPSKLSESDMVSLANIVF